MGKDTDVPLEYAEIDGVPITWKKLRAVELRLEGKKTVRQIAKELRLNKDTLSNRRKGWPAQTWYKVLRRRLAEEAYAETVDGLRYSAAEALAEIRKGLRSKSIARRQEAIESLRRFLAGPAKIQIFNPLPGGELAENRRTIEEVLEGEDNGDRRTPNADRMGGLF